MTRKKVVFVLVEGPSDDAALGVILNKLFDKNRVHIEICHGDVTSCLDIDPDNIVSAIGDIVKKYANSMHFSQSDFKQVIHIVDMDGAYVPSAAIVSDPKALKTKYLLTEIQTNNPNKIILRNKHKQNKLNRLSRRKTIWGSIPYQVYYMSCNLDHVLHNKLNSTDEEKENDAYKFAIKYKNDIDGFLRFICESDFSQISGYKESWDFIKQDLHSLERYTNIGLCLAQIKEERSNLMEHNKL